MFDTSHNVYLWIHVMGGGFFAGLIYYLTRRFTFESREKFAVIGVIALAIIWECLEYLVWGISVYASMQTFLIDALQDIAGAVIMAVMVVVAISKNQLFY
jgi:hypothetical protein